MVFVSKLKKSSTGFLSLAPIWSNDTQEKEQICPESSILLIGSNSFQITLLVPAVVAVLSYAKRFQQ